MKLIAQILCLTAFLAAPPAEGAILELKVLASSRIVPPAVVQRFEARHDIRVRFEYFDSSEALSSYLESRPGGDVALIRGHYLGDLIKNGQLAPLNHALLPNLKNLDPRYTEAGPDPGSRYAVPYLVGNIGLIYRCDVLDNPPGLRHLFDPEAPTVPFAIVSQYRDAMGMALKYLGYSYNSTSFSQIENGFALLESLGGRPVFLAFLSNDSILRFLKEGIIYMALSYNSEAAKIMGEDPRLAYAPLPNHRVGWSYSLVINESSPLVAEAHLWIDYLMEPEAAAEIAQWNRATSPNLAALELLPQYMRDDPALYPEGGVWHGAEIPGSVGEAGKTYVEYWHRL